MSALSSSPSNPSMAAHLPDELDGSIESGTHLVEGGQQQANAGLVIGAEPVNLGMQFSALRSAIAGPVNPRGGGHFLR